MNIDHTPTGQSAPSTSAREPKTEDNHHEAEAAPSPAHAAPQTSGSEEDAAAVLKALAALEAKVFFEKQLTSSDASGSGRVVIPKVCFQDKRATRPAPQRLHAVNCLQSPQCRGCPFAGHAASNNGCIIISVVTRLRCRSL